MVVSRYLNNDLELKHGPLAVERAFPSDSESRVIKHKEDDRGFSRGYEDGSPLPIAQRLSPLCSTNCRFTQYVMTATLPAHDGGPVMMVFSHSFSSGGIHNSGFPFLQRFREIGRSAPAGSVAGVSAFQKMPQRMTI